MATALRLRLGCAIFGAVLAGASAFGSDFNYRSVAIPGCEEGMAYIATFDFSDPGFKARFEWTVVANGFLDQTAALAAAQLKGHPVVAMVNAGYFKLGGPLIYSYYKSTLHDKSASVNSSMGPRACIVHDRAAETFKVVQSTPPNYRRFERSQSTEIFCAGPELVRTGVNVTDRQICAEKFSAACRPGHSDSGINPGESLPRTGSCFTHSGAVKFFHYSSPSQRCGITLNGLSEAMRSEGCESGLNHDGGGSSKIYLNDGEHPVVFASGTEGDRDRAIPVWVAIIRK